MAVYDINGNKITDDLPKDPYLEPELLADVQRAKEKVERINQTHPCCNFLYLTDTHLSAEGQLMQSKNTVDPGWSLAVAKEICKSHWVEAVVFGGDLINAYVYSAGPLLSDACERISVICRELYDMGIPCYFVKGNHDLSSKYDQQQGDTTYPNRVSDGVWNMLTRPFEKNAVFNPADEAGYFYVDLSNNVRLCVWNQYTGNTIDSTGSDGNGTSNAESSWFGKNGYDDPVNKTVVTLYHNPDSYASSENMTTRFYCDGGKYGHQWPGGGRAIVINSHRHEDGFGYIYEGAMKQNVPDFNHSRAFAVTKSTASNVHIDVGAERYCVSVFSIDPVNRHAYMTRIGRGEDKDSEFCTR